MSNHQKTSSEASFQERFVRELKKYKWDAPDFLDGNKKKVTVNDLINHWRSELNRLNADQLEGLALTDSEFAQVLAKVSLIDNSFEAAKILAMEGSTGKIDGIYRDDHPNITRKQITLTIFKKAEVRGGDSSYKIAREVVTASGNRFDVVLLINGLPLINIEQKRADKSLDEAFGQFKRYYRDGEYINNFMAFSQMMVIMSEVATRYFATPKSINDFNLSFVFQWADKYNTPINDWQEVVAHFLMIPMAHQLVGDYLIIDEAKDEENRKHMIMRPYQVYALQAVEGAAFGWDNDGVPHGGYVWHTTGSGKTITSFKTALFLSIRGGFDKVVFLVDRRELDNRTSENFKAYAAYEAVSVDDTKHTYHLRKQLLSIKRGIIVTTTFKLNALVKDLLEAQDYNLSDKKIVFIIDEAHRTTMGQMMGTIKSYFKKNGLFYGFTGTPLFDENEITGMINEKSEVIDTTEKLFGPELHKYTIDQAIADGNVLGFHVDYINTGEFLNHDDLREQIIADIEIEKPNVPTKEIEHQIIALSDAEIEDQAKKRELLVYHDETHIPQVVKEILANWEGQSQARKFNGILTLAYKNRVIAYYQEFKKQLKDNLINIAMTFSFGDGKDVHNDLPMDILQMMFKDYAAFTGIEFVYGDKKQGEEAYFEDLIARATRGGSGRNKKNIDLILVADQLLTGYDSKFLNTLYVDRSLEKQGLIQAYSRTNRIYGKDKEFGSIINFKYPRITEELVNSALKLYGSGGKSSKVIVDHYETAVQSFALKVQEMIDALGQPSDWETLKNDDQAKEVFILSFREASNQLRLIMQYYQFEWDEMTFKIDEHTWLKYLGAYKNLRSKKEEDPDDDVIVNPMVRKTKLSGTQVIDANHILRLIGSQIKSDDGIQRVDQETLRIIYEEIQELSDLGEDEHAKLLKEFVETELVPGLLSSNLNFDESFEAWKERKIAKEISAFAKDWGIDESLLSKSFGQFSAVKEEGIPYINDLSKNTDFNTARNQEAGSQLQHMILLVNDVLPDWMVEIKQKYN